MVRAVICVWGGGGVDENGDPIPGLGSYWLNKKSSFTKVENILLRDLIKSYYDPRTLLFLTWDSVEESSSDIIQTYKRVGTVYPFVQHKKFDYFDFPDRGVDNIGPTDRLKYYVQAKDIPNHNHQYDTIQILYDDRWKGFGIEQSQDIIFHMPELTLDFEAPEEGHGRAIFINGQPICVGRKITLIYDLKEKTLFKIQR